MSAAADFFKWREDWLQLVPVRNQHGGWDVHLVVDEGYGDLADALRHCDNYRHKIEQACTDDGMPLGMRRSPLRLRAEVVDQRPPSLPAPDPEDPA